MEMLCVSLFGSVRAKFDDCPDEIKLTPTLQGLLAYLLLNEQRSYPRAVLFDLFWGETNEERSRGSLNTALWRLRRLLEPEGIPPGTYLRNSHADEISFNSASPYWLDVAVFQRAARRILDQPIEALSEDDIRACESALGLYTGDLLEGFYDNWAIGERERFRLQYLQLLISVSQYHKIKGDYAKSLGYALKVIALDPLREDVHREVMRLYVYCGQRALALSQYEACCAVLRQELDVPPMEETRLLYRQIRAEEPERAEAPPAEEPVCLARVLREFRAARDTLELAQGQLHQALQLFERFSIRDRF